MTHRFVISQDSPVLYITVVTKDRLPVFRRDEVLPIFSEGMFMEKLNYIHLNPVRAGLSERAPDYRWSSARIWHGCPLENEPLSVDKDLIYWRRRG
jgi:hypothetical protein